VLPKVMVVLAASKRMLASDILLVGMSRTEE
jgi:hypothetical protein